MKYSLNLCSTTVRYVHQQYKPTIHQKYKPTIYTCEQFEREPGAGCRTDAGEYAKLSRLFICILFIQQNVLK